MRPGIFITISVILMSISVAGLKFSRSHPRGGLLCEMPVYDFGSVTPSESARLEHTFVLRNDTAKQVIIKKIATSCGCTSALPPEVPLPVGKTVNIPVHINWFHRNGRQQSSIEVETDSPETPTLQLMVVASVKGQIAISPDQINFGDVNADESPTGRVSILQVAGSQPFNILGVENDSHHFQIRRADGGPLEGRPGDFLVTAVPSRTSLQETDMISFHTDIAGGEDFALKVAAQFKPAIIAEPQAILCQYTGTSGEEIGADANVLTKSDVSETVIGRDAGAFTVITKGRIIDSEGRQGFKFTIEFKVKDPPVGIYTAELRVEAGEDKVDIPLVAIQKGSAYE